MKAFLQLTVYCVLLTASCLLVSPPKTVYASSERAYNDYLYQLDVYRQKYNEFKIAKNEYDKFKTLTSQTTTLEKTKSMLSSRDILLKTYLTLLNEKLLENIGISQSERNLYQTLITNENTFLNDHSQLVSSIGSLEDCVEVSGNLESHYRILSASIRQTIIGLALGRTNVMAQQFDTTLAGLNSFVTAHRTDLSQSKQTIVDRWIITVQDKRRLYQQKIDSVTRINSALKGADLDELERQTTDMQKSITEAKTYLMEGSSNIHEIVNIIKEKN
jgi:hypothetical protein